MKSSTDWNADTARVLTFYKNLLSVIGLWVLDEKNIFSRLRWFLATIIEMSTTITLVMEVIRHCHGHEDALDAFLIASSSVISISKLLLHRVNWRQKLLLVEAIIHDWTYVKESCSRDIMLKYARKGKLVSSTLFYLGCISCVFIASTIVPVNIGLPWIIEKQVYNKMHERKLILAAYCIFGNYTSRYIVAYGLIEVLQMLQVLVNCVSQCSNDGFFFGLTMHVCGQFEILKMNFAEINADKIYYRAKLDLLLKRHCHLIYLADTLEKAFTFVILTQLFMSVILLCIEGFQLILSFMMHDTFTALKHVLFIIILLVQLFLYCLAGQMLEYQTENLSYAIYETPWYNFDLNVMKSLPLIILRTTNPHQLTAGKFLSMNFMSFKEILKASASYLSVLRMMIKI